MISILRCAALIFFLLTQNGLAIAQINYKHVSINKTAQSLFNEGMVNYYGYLYVQAEYNFRQALIFDPHCGLCYWGLALAKKQEALELGQSFGAVGFDFIKKAEALMPPEQKHQFLYDVVEATKPSFSLDQHANNKQLQIKTINAYRDLYQKYKANPEWQAESLALLVDAMAYYPSINEVDNVDDGGGAGNHCGGHASNGYQKEALTLLRDALQNKRWPDHPGLMHTYIHLAERDLSDPLGLVVAKKLPSFSGKTNAHYTHMSNHIYWRRGMYQDAIKANKEAIAIDEYYFKHGGIGLNTYYYDYHFLHSHHFLVALGILTNQYELAIHYARQIKDLMDVNRIKDLKDYRDTLLSLDYLVLARFNKWHEILQLRPSPYANELAILFVNFSKSLAFLHLDRHEAFKHLFEQIKKTTYTRPKKVELKTLVVSYLIASEMEKNHSSLSQLEQVFLDQHVAEIEEKLFSMNPPLWFFPYHLFLSDAAVKRSDLVAAKKYHLLYENRYPGSSL